MPVLLTLGPLGAGKMLFGLESLVSCPLGQLENPPPIIANSVFESPSGERVLVNRVSRGIVWFQPLRAESTRPQQWSVRAFRQIYPVQVR